MDQREERISVETDRYRATGFVTLPRDGYRSRMTDYLNAIGDGFLALTDVELVPLDGTATATRHEFLAVAVGQIRIAMPVPAPGSAR